MPDTNASDPRQPAASEPPAGFPDPVLVAMVDRLRALRRELDRLDAEANSYTGLGRESIVTALLMCRETVDEVEARLEDEAAGR